MRSSALAVLLLASLAPAHALAQEGNGDRLARLGAVFPEVDRLIRSFEGEADGITTDQVIDELVRSVPSRPQPVEQAVQGSR